MGTNLVFFFLHGLGLKVLAIYYKKHEKKMPIKDGSHFVIVAKIDV